MKKLLGQLTGGSLTEGFTMRIAPDAALEQLKTGKFVCIEGSQFKFFSLITNLSLAVTNPDILLFPPTEHEKLLTQLLKQWDMYATAELKPMLMLGTDNKPMPVKTIPPHFAAIYEATAKDVALNFW